MRRGVRKKDGVSNNLGLFELSGEWQLRNDECAAAWEAYVEPITRISTVPLRRDEGSAPEVASRASQLRGSAPRPPRHPPTKGCGRPRAPLRSDLETTCQTLTADAGALALAYGVPNVLDAVTSPSAHSTSDATVVAPGWTTARR